MRDLLAQGLSEALGDGERERVGRFIGELPDLPGIVLQRLENTELHDTPLGSFCVVPLRFQALMVGGTPGEKGAIDRLDRWAEILFGAQPLAICATYDDWPAELPPPVVEQVGSEAIFTGVYGVDVVAFTTQILTEIHVEQ